MLPVGDYRVGHSVLSGKVQIRPVRVPVIMKVGIRARFRDISVLFFIILDLKRSRNLASKGQNW